LSKCFLKGWGDLDFKNDHFSINRPSHDLNSTSPEMGCVSINPYIDSFVIHGSNDLMTGLENSLAYNIDNFKQNILPAIVMHLLSEIRKKCYILLTQHEAIKRGTVNLATASNDNALIAILEDDSIKELLDQNSFEKESIERSIMKKQLLCNIDIRFISVLLLIYAIKGMNIINIVQHSNIAKSSTKFNVNMDVMFFGWNAENMIKNYFNDAEFLSKYIADHLTKARGESGGSETKEIHEVEVKFINYSPHQESSGSSIEDIFNL